jgi:AraC-like DNA-binding protein
MNQVASQSTTTTIDPTGAGSALSGGDITFLAIAAIIAVLAIVALAILRERHHRNRREDLQSRLANLENIIIGLSVIPSGGSTDASASDPKSAASVTSKILAPRGPLSTAISTIRSDLGPELPGPDRIDLRATCFVYDRLEQALTPGDLAEGLNLSLRSLQRSLSGSLGCTPRELILAVKMREAKRRLLDDGYRVQEAARAVGFDDPFHFSRRFKAYYRMSPTEMQNQASRSVA